MKAYRVVDRKMFSNFYFKALVLIFSISYGTSVPVDYCFHPLNKDDCGVKPTPVFSYYKSGSRCEIEMWRGCPTFNMFTDEFLCSHHCIGKLWDRESDNEIDLKPIKDECLVPMNEDNCGIEGEFKYTFNGTSCTKVEWKGCKSENIFDDEETCEDTCNQSELKNDLENLNMDDAEAINSILDRALADNSTEPPKILQLKITVPQEDETTPEPIIATATETASETIEPTSDVVETTNETEETASETVETTSEDGEAAETETEEATSEGEAAPDAETSTDADTETIAPDTVTAEVEETTTELAGEGSAEEVITT